MLVVRRTFYDLNYATLRLKREKNHQETLKAVGKAIYLAESESENISELGEGWIAEEALSIAVYCALRNEHDFAKGVLEAVNIQGDRDSVGAITGNLLGAINGMSAIPVKWQDNLLEKDLIINATQQLQKCAKESLKRQ